MLHCSKTGADMTELNERGREPQESDSTIGNWRVIVSAWAVALLFIILFAGVQAVASLHGVSPEQASLAGAIVPQHDPACAGPGFPDASADGQCRPSSLLDRAQADAYASW